MGQAFVWTIALSTFPSALNPTPQVQASILQKYKLRFFSVLKMRFVSETDAHIAAAVNATKMLVQCL